MSLSHEHLRSKILAKIKIYILSRAELLCSLCYEIPCKSDSKDTQCYYCGQIISVTEIKEHMSQTHGSYHGRMHGILRPIQCDNCKATFKTESALGLHLCYDQYIPKKKYGEPYKCEKCNKNYQNRKTFRYHLQSAHTAEKKYKCDKCGFSTKTSSALSSHVHRVHTKVELVKK